MNTTPRFLLSDAWTPDQTFAVYEFCQSLADTLWERYEAQLFERTVQKGREHGFYDNRSPQGETLDLPFDDDLPF